MAEGQLTVESLSPPIGDEVWPNIGSNNSRVPPICNSSAEWPNQITVSSWISSITSRSSLTWGNGRFGFSSGFRCTYSRIAVKKLPSDGLYIFVSKGYSNFVPL